MLNHSHDILSLFLFNMPWCLCVLVLAMALCLVVILIHIFILVLFLRLSFYSSLCFTLFSSFTNCFWASPRLVLVLVSFLVLHFVKIFLLLLVFNLVLVLQNVFVIVLFLCFNLSSLLSLSFCFSYEVVSESNATASAFRFI